MAHWTDRTRLLLGEQGMEKLKNARAVVLGLGGVGGNAAEALCRAGVGHLLLVDNDTVDETNLNRQLLATRDMVGRPKCEAALARLRAIDPEADLQTAQQFYLPENSSFVFDFEPDIIIDAIDTVTAKLHLAEQCHQRGILLYASMGTGNRLDPSLLRCGDIGETSGTGCPLARVMRRELRKRGVPGLKVVYSLEPPIQGINANDGEHGRHSPGSAPFVPPAAGLLLASAALRDFLEQKKK
ncbi:MAG: tRNA threonylcarbamoyladenosine dehydratase [Oscillospiraceae bacterium]|nr:tRNA threonylcarbamoyladenosine dehydratase [Oscillospiraceae bacterium]